ncbi:hypothetical protein IMG5_173440 [Ichthyophthirius multifiliis]|uniref:Uncharacterized protein n=1 Tax=Ichthyophthirius multifiliis TaxID=5932 RepID=G0R1X5_ICHMU|nr:hypothetical protein IMG5_173440 [Ichthyophthirius multifiliis]EGR28527.1 hypothetical protein IMG5_173440 [Ichthyophthirius multifiliis]|eukprot:XP_004029763.1 hypothetical protein IMG5_173440 [Ichthyophthirius multifiliis]
MKKNKTQKNQIKKKLYQDGQIIDQKMPKKSLQCPLESILGLFMRLYYQRKAIQWKNIKNQFHKKNKRLTCYYVDSYLLRIQVYWQVRKRRNIPKIQKKNKRKTQKKANKKKYLKCGQIAQEQKRLKQIIQFKMQKRAFYYVNQWIFYFPEKWI